MKPDGDLFAVVTGDIVGFSELSDAERRALHIAFDHCAQKMSDFYPGYLLDKPEIFRGDSYQFTILSTSHSLRMSLFFRALIKASLPGRGLDTRMSIGIGTVDYLPGDEISSGDGQAYRLSGEGLESIEKPYLMTVRFHPSIESRLTKSLQVILRFMDQLAKKWTEAQSKVISGALLDMTQDAIAKEWLDTQVTQPAIAQHLDRAGWAVIKDGLDFYESSLASILSGNEETG